ncbi:hypothetical protein, partial [Klebsiella pneumoniae]|uniref:hypothetical protein n=1 Tax=Klebsiella pneumoniae TaxID=573 RepID=UPI0019530947
SILPPKVMTALRFWLNPATIYRLHFVGEKIRKHTERHIQIFRHGKMQAPSQKTYRPHQPSFGRFSGGSIKTLNASSSWA